MWLNDFGLDIRCVRMKPYVDGGQVFLDVQTVIPLPEVADYQIRIHEKNKQNREARKRGRDYTKYDVSIAGEHHQSQQKNWTMFRLIAGVLANSGTPEQVAETITTRSGTKIFREMEGSLSAEEVYERIMEDDGGGKVKLADRYFCKEDQIFYADGKTYVLSNDWSGDEAPKAADLLKKAFPDLGIDVRPSL